MDGFVQQPAGAVHRRRQHDRRHHARLEPRQRCHPPRARLQVRRLRPMVRRLPWARLPVLPWSTLCKFIPYPFHKPVKSWLLNAFKNMQNSLLYLFLWFTDRFTCTCDVWLSNLNIKLFPINICSWLLRKLAGTKCVMCCRKFFFLSFYTEAIKFWFALNFTTNTKYRDTVHCNYWFVFVPQTC